jgi:hypothetical protein
MAERKNTHGMKLSYRSGIAVVDIGDMEIWDGADLSLVRDTLQVLIARRRRQVVGVEMRWVKYIPSGFFGMLYDWYEADVTVYLLNPQPCVERMLWFQRFFLEERPGVWRLEDLHETGIDAETSDAEVETIDLWYDAPSAPRVPSIITG